MSQDDPDALSQAIPHVGNAPAQAPEINNKREFSKGEKAIAIVGGLAVAAGVGGFAAYKGLESGTEKGINDVFGDKGKQSVQTLDTPNPAHSLLGDTNHDGTLSKNELNAMSPTDVADVPPSVLVAGYGPYFDSSREIIYSSLLNHNNLTPDQQNVISLPTGSKESYSDQNVLNEVMIDSDNAATQPDSNEGERLLPLVFNKSAGGFTDTLSFIEKNGAANTKTPLVNAYQQFGPSLPHPQGSFNGIDLSDYSQVRVIAQNLIPSTSNTAPSSEFGLYGLIKNGQNEEWQLVRRWKSSDTNVQTAVNTLVASATSNSR